MQERNDAWMREFALSGCQYEWNLDSAQILFRSDTVEVVADICVVGSVSEAQGTFLWAWANEEIPCQARRGLDKVRALGESNSLELLPIPDRGGRAPEVWSITGIWPTFLAAR